LGFEIVPHHSNPVRPSEVWNHEHLLSHDLGGFAPHSSRDLKLTHIADTLGLLRRGRRPYDRRELNKNAARRLAVIRHTEEVTRNVSLTCRYYGIARQTFYKRLRRYEEQGSRTEQRGTASSE
jgi:hypothetical protein